MKIQNVSCKIICAILIFSLLFEMQCASIQRKPISEFHSNELMSEEQIFVIMKNNEEYEMSNISISDNRLVGVVLSSLYTGGTMKTQDLKIINVEDIAYIEIVRNPTSSSSFASGACVGILAGVGFVGAIVYILLLSSAGNWD